MNELIFYIECPKCHFVNKKLFDEVIINDYTSINCSYCKSILPEEHVLHSITIHRIGLNEQISGNSSTKKESKKLNYFN